jgi:hypothetical protein
LTRQTYGGWREYIHQLRKVELWFQLVTSLNRAKLLNDIYGYTLNLLEYIPSFKSVDLLEVGYKLKPELHFGN